MKRAGRIIYVAVCLALCVSPFVGMLVRPSDTTTENRELAEFPKIREDGRWNLDFLKGLGGYFKDHFAFRPALVSADAEIQSRVFGVSNVDTVTVGRDGWLYYTATVDDYLGRDVLSERGIENIAHNLSLVQQYVQGMGADFLFTVPPNKNSLYGENMPYHLQKKASRIRNIDRLEKAMKEQGIAYVDLFSLFQEQDEVLYLKRDSHWNEKGAVLAYHAILDRLGKEHDAHETTKILREKKDYGDLNTMLYPLTAEPEWYYLYQRDDTFSYQTDTESVEDAWIMTRNKKASGSLLMFRDSFGNTLLPLMANVFSEGYFSKGVPQDIARYMETYRPDVVVIEKVERNLSELGADPPLIEARETDLVQRVEEAPVSATLNAGECESDPAYWEISGVLEGASCKEDAQVYVRVTDAEGQKTYQTYSVTDAGSDHGYRLYLKKEKLHGGPIDVEVIVGSGGEFRAVRSERLTLPEG